MEGFSVGEEVLAKCYSKYKVVKIVAITGDMFLVQLDSGEVFEVKPEDVEKL